jgi:hypothetical protein
MAQKYFSTADFDAVQVQISSGYDLGFINNTVVYICDSTQGCRYKVVNHNILRLFNFHMTYEIDWAIDRLEFSSNRHHPNFQPDRPNQHLCSISPTNLAVISPQNASHLKPVAELSGSR